MPIREERDECQHGVFYTTYRVYDDLGRWRGDYTDRGRACEALARLRDRQPSVFKQD